MSVFEQLGSLALATRLKLLSESLAKDVAGVYRQLDIPFEPRWFTLFWTLKQKPAITITELAQELRQTHAAAVQLTNLLEKKGLVFSSKDKNDERRRQVSLTDKGLKLFEQVVPVLNAIEQANSDLLLLSAPGFLDSLKVIELALDHKNMHDRIMENLGLINQGVTIKRFAPAYKEDFARMNREWIIESFGNLAVADNTVPEHPEEEIISQGGIIFLAFYQQEVVGTVAIEEPAPGSLLLSTFTVKKVLRGKGIGKALFEQSKAYAHAKGASSLQIHINPDLTDNINFFIRQGFYMAPKSSQETQGIRRNSLKLSFSLQQQTTA